MSVDPFEELLLGPAFGMQQILHRNNLSLGDVGVVEFHEGDYHFLFMFIVSYFIHTYIILMYYEYY